jgi:hypothetical protein
MRNHALRESECIVPRSSHWGKVILTDIVPTVVQAHGNVYDSESSDIVYWISLIRSPISSQEAISLSRQVLIRVASNVMRPADE